MTAVSLERLNPCSLSSHCYFSFLPLLFLFCLSEPKRYQIPSLGLVSLGYPFSCQKCLLYPLPLSPLKNDWPFQGICSMISSNRLQVIFSRSPVINAASTSNLFVDVPPASTTTNDVQSNTNMMQSKADSKSILIEDEQPSD